MLRRGGRFYALLQLHVQASAHTAGSTAAHLPVDPLVGNAHQLHAGRLQLVPRAPHFHRGVATEDAARAPQRKHEHGGGRPQARGGDLLAGAGRGWGVWWVGGECGLGLTAR